MELLIPLSLFVFSTNIFLSKNPVYGVLSFVIVVAHVVILLIGLNLEFLAYVLAIVYIGAIVVLFLFVIMMFYIREAQTGRSFYRGLAEYTLLGVAVTTLLSLYAVYATLNYTDYAALVAEKEFFRLLSYLLFNELWLLTVAVTLIMFIGIVGTIILTLREASITRITPARVRAALQDTIEQRQ